MTAAARRAIAAVVALEAIGALAAACSYDFHAFDPTGAADAGSSDAPDAADAGGGDAADDGPGSMDPGDAAPGDAAADGGPSCTAPPVCYAQAGSCAASCATQEQDCEKGLGCALHPKCVDDCKDAEATCQSGCAAACTVCTADAGCVDLSGCSAAAR